jgi:hypothetical protein
MRGPHTSCCESMFPPFSAVERVKAKIAIIWNPFGEERDTSKERKVELGDIPYDVARKNFQEQKKREFATTQAFSGGR